MLWKKRIVVVPLMLASAGLCFAQTREAEHEEKPEQLINELFVGENVYVQDRGEWVGVVAGSFAKGSDEKEWELEGEVKYGLTDRFQLSGEVPLVYVDPDGEDSHFGVGDLTLAANYNIFQQDTWAVAIRNAFILPTGASSRDLGGGEFVWEPSLLAYARVGRGEIYGGVGEDFGDDADHLIYTAAAVWPLCPRTVGVLELDGTTGGGEDTLYFVPGTYVHFGEKTQLGVGVPIGLTDDSDDWGVILKFIHEF
jgi:Putative MetA-pathway of phenol degradation